MLNTYTRVLICRFSLCMKNSHSINQSIKWESRRIKNYFYAEIVADTHNHGTKNGKKFNWQGTITLCISLTAVFPSPKLKYHLMASRFRKPARSPKFGVQENGDKTGNTVHPSIFKQARKSGQLNLSGRSMTKGDTFPKLAKGTRACVTIFFIPRLTTLLVFRVVSRGIKKKL